MARDFLRSASVPAVLALGALAPLLGACTSSDESLYVGRTSTQSTATATATATSLGGAAPAPTSGPQLDVGGAPADGGGGAGGLDEDSACESITQAAENQRQGADIIIVVDQSSSMVDETLFVRDQLNDFADRVVDLGIDAHVVLIAERPDGVDILGQVPSCEPEESYIENPICIPEPLAGPNCQDNLPIFKSVSCHVDSTDAYESVLDTWEIYEGVLRPGATKHVVVITDDYPDMAGSAFQAALEAKDPALMEGFFFHGIVQYSSCGYDVDGLCDYRALVAATGGVDGDLALQDFEPVWDRVVETIDVVTGLECEWEIPPAPPGKTFDAAQLNVRYTDIQSSRELGRVANVGQCDDDYVDGWYYDDPDEPQSIQVCPRVCNEIQAGIGQEMQILFGCESQVAVFLR